ncbi:MAG: hypothetical protein AAGA47_00785 [Pseudomonadota bacterium]
MTLRKKRSQRSRSTHAAQTVLVGLEAFYRQAAQTKANELQFEQARMTAVPRPCPIQKVTASIRTDRTWFVAKVKKTQRDGWHWLRPKSPIHAIHGCASDARTVVLFKLFLREFRRSSKQKPSHFCMLPDGLDLAAKCPSI